MARRKEPTLRFIARFHHGINDGCEIGVYNTSQQGPPVQFRVRGRVQTNSGVVYDYVYDLASVMMNEQYGVPVAEYFVVGHVPVHA